MLLRLKSPVPVAQKNRNVMIGGEEIGDSQVELAVAVEVTHGAASRCILQPKPQRRLKGPVTVPQDQRNPEGELPTVNQVEMTVAVKIVGQHELPGSTGRKAHLVLEGPVALAQEHGKVRGVA